MVLAAGEQYGCGQQTVFDTDQGLRYFTLLRIEVDGQEAT
jgi:hypothetical protein